MLTIPRCSPGLGLRVGKRALVEKLHEIFCEKNIQRPIDRHAHFLFHARQFAPVNSAPEKPSQEPGKVHAKDSRDTGAPPDRSQRSERFETERLFRRSVNARDNVLSDDFAFARCMLRGRRTIFASRGIGHQCAVTQRPQTIHAFHLEIRIYFDPTAFFWARDKIENRIRRYASGPDQR